MAKLTNVKIICWPPRRINIPRRGWVTLPEGADKWCCDRNIGTSWRKKYVNGVPFYTKYMDVGVCDRARHLRGQQRSMRQRSMRGLGMVPGYTDVSHFRAPYKESNFLQGFGSEGAIDPEVAMAQFVDTDEKTGIYRWKPEVVQALGEKLKAMLPLAQQEDVVHAVLPANEAEAAALVENMPLGADTAAAWVTKKLREGKIVFAEYSLVFPPANAGRLVAVDKNDAEAVKMTSYMAPILAEPGLVDNLFAMGAGGLLLVGLAGGGIYLLATRKKRAVPNRRRRRRARRR
jgi:hypothetical protein